MKKLILLTLITVFGSAIASPYIKTVVIKQDEDGFYSELGEVVKFRKMKPNKIYAYFANEDEELKGNITYRMSLPFQSHLPALKQIMFELGNKYETHSNGISILPPINLAIHAVLPGSYFDTSNINKDMEWNSFRLVNTEQLEWLATPTEERPRFDVNTYGRISWAMEKGKWALNAGRTMASIQIWIGSYTYLQNGMQYTIVGAPSNDLIINIFLNQYPWRL